MLTNGLIGQVDWVVREPSACSRDWVIMPQGFASVDSAEHRGPFTEKHLVARALGLRPPGSRSLRRLESKGARDAGADWDTDADLAPELDSGASEDASDEMSNDADRMQVHCFFGLADLPTFADLSCLALPRHPNIAKRDSFFPLIVLDRGRFLHAIAFCGP